MSTQGSPRLRTRSGTVAIVELVGDDCLDLFPGQRGGDLATGPGPREPRAEDRLVGGVLVEVDEHPIPRVPPSTSWL